MKTKLFLVGAFICAGLSVSAQDWAKARLEKSPRHGEWVDVKNGSRTVHCFIVYSEVKNPAAAVIVIHEIFGLTDWARSAADEVAAAGYIAIAPDLLSAAKGGGSSDFASVDDVRAAIFKLPPAQITADLNAVADYVKALPAANGKLAVAGFCWGGGQTFRFACNRPDLKAAFVFYGPPPDGKEMQNIKCPVVWLLRRRRRAHQRHHSGHGEAHEGRGQELQTGDLLRRRPRFHARGRTTRCGRGEPEGP